MILLGSSSTTNVSTDTAIDDAGKVGGIAVNVGGAAGLVDAGVLGLVVVELDGVGLGGVGGGRGRLDGGDDRVGGDLLAAGNVGDGKVAELGEGDLAGALGLDLVEEQIAVGGGPLGVDDLALLAHLGEVRVVHLVLGARAKAGEGFEGGLKVRHFSVFFLEKKKRGIFAEGKNY